LVKLLVVIIGEVSPSTVSAGVGYTVVDRTLADCIVI
jgi:hypothetical protein